VHRTVTLPSGIKRISYAGGSIVTGNAVTAALLEYATTVADAENSVAVDVTVLEENGETSVHTLLLSPASQFDVADVDGISPDDEEQRFPVPEMPTIGMQGSVETAEHGRRAAEQFDDIISEIDDGLGQ
jgi:hypothetical protein